MARRSYAGIVKSGLIAAGAVAFATSAFADGAYEPMPVVEAASPANQLELSASTALTTDYVFRGISQTGNDPAIQGSFDATYGIFYAGAWASNVDFGGDDHIEIDYYAGITPTFAGLDWDFGIVAYTYPGGDTDDLWEAYGGVSKTFMDDKLALGFTTYAEVSGYDYWVFEGTAGYTFDKVSIFTPTLGGTVGTYTDDGDGDYTYWNAGLTLAFYKEDMFSLDIRYWDTDIDSDLSDERIVGTLSASF